MRGAKRREPIELSAPLFTESGRGSWSVCYFKCPQEQVMVPENRTK